MIPYICGGIAMVGWGLLSDRMNERRWHLLVACAVSTIGLVIAGMTMGTWWALVGMTIAAMGFYGSKGPFWAMPPMFLTGTAAAGAIAWINSLGNLGGFFGSWYVGVMKALTGSYAGGLYGLALFGLISAFISAFFLHIPNPAASARASAAIADRTGPHTRIGARCSRCAIIYQENKNAFEIRGRSDTCLRPTAAYC